MRRFFAHAEAAAPPPWPTGDPDVGDMYATLMQADYSHEDAIDAVLPLRRLGQLLQAPRRLEGRAAGQKRCGDNEIISGSGGA